MAYLQILKSSPSPVSVSRSNFPGKSVCVFSKSDSRKKNLGFRSSAKRYSIRRRIRVCCAVQDGDNKANGEEPPESLFLKELKRRGMTPTSLLDEYEADVEMQVGSSTSSKRTAASTEIDKSLSNQREVSMALNSEGLEGLFPRAKVLLTIGGTFFLAFWPLIVLTVTIFSAVYFYFGSSFIHDGTETPVSPPPYIDPYALLEDERVSQIASRVN